MASSPRLFLAAVASSAVLGFALGRVVVQPVPATPPADPPPGAALGSKDIEMLADLGQIIVPIWREGRIAGYVAAAISLRLAPGSAPSELMPILHDRMLATLIDAGAEGRLDPGTADPAALSAALLEAARDAIGPDRVRSLDLSKLVRQENRAT
ncbi:hypothetical protein [Rhodospirillum centenum]|uniref:Flagellar basal body-associated protein FliL n=1 Tax=Rhodospirillum centenum (strain ATCC 51521 / SW) TaxID=414684 RepID=B6IQD4_RHOCS|nr:hypothetical protein [Rhodospirillum centenum]ACI97670.1 hypothetical protein RC1_0221 [Rhodospirillum centenum SW]